MAVADVTVKLAALTPLNRTAVAPVKFVPLIVTPVPTGPLAGVKLVIVGAGVTVKLAALTPLNRTAVAPVKFMPLIVTLVPTGPLAGVKLVIVGALDDTVKLVALVAVPPGVVTLSGPVVAAAGTVVCIAVSAVTEKAEALTPLNVTAVAPVKFVPLIVTLVPTGPLAGV